MNAAQRRKARRAPKKAEFLAKLKAQKTQETQAKPNEKANSTR